MKSIHRREAGQYRSFRSDTLRKRYLFLCAAASLSSSAFGRKNYPKLSCCFFLIFTFNCCLAQPDSSYIKINFLYGSKPAPGFKGTEKKRFGGLKGGHVNIELDGKCLDFGPGVSCHVFPNDKKPHGTFRISPSTWWDTLTEKSAYILVPVSAAQKDSLKKIFESYSTKTPYDYAMFGNRCASASYQVLSSVGLTEQKSVTGNIVSNFYPKLLRKKLYKWAAQHHYTVKKFEGRSSRIWEEDGGMF